MAITLSSPVLKVIAVAKTVTLSTLTIERVVDLPAKKTVRVFLSELSDAVVLWEGAAYDAIGQWTDANVEARLRELFV